MTLWADDLYMSVPFLAGMGRMTGERKYFDDAVKQALNFNNYLYNLPATHPKRNELIKLLARQITGIADHISFYYQRPKILNDFHALGAVLLAGTEMLRWNAGN